MRDFENDLLAHFQSRGAQNNYVMVWFQGKDIATRDPVEIGFWTGADHEVFTIDGQERTYYGAGGAVEIPPMSSQIGVQVRTLRLSFSAVANEVLVATQNYDLREGAFQMHIVYHDALTGQLKGTPKRIFKGVTAGLEITRPETGGEAKAEISVQSSARMLTRTSSLKKSSSGLQSRYPDDDFRQYVTLSGSIETVWGEQRAAAPTPAVTSTPSTTSPVSPYPTTSPNR
jgi:hypothetical protein